MSNYAIWLFLQLLDDYEPALVDIIISYLPKNIKLRIKVNMWCNPSSRMKCEDEFGHISVWDVSGITDMAYLFMNCKTFNDDISRWDVSSVSNMMFIFYNCYNFNQPLNSWDVSNVINMKEMFEYAIAFNQPLYSWNVSNVKTMKWMFYRAKYFNQPETFKHFEKYTTNKLM